MFAETYSPTQKPAARRFAVIINGVKYRSALDVFKAAGADKPLFVSFPNIKASNGLITITLARIPGAENPMLSGFIIVGKNPAGVINPDGSGGGSGGSTGNPATADPNCSKGIFGENASTGQKACCEKACGKCGGSGCGAFYPGKWCCISSVYNNAPSCDVASAPCVPTAKTSSAPAPNPGTGKCDKGISGTMKNSGQKACCPSACGQCGGPGCWSAPPGGKNCCIKPILKAKKSCDTNPPPCILGNGNSGDDTPVQSPSSDPGDGGSGKCPISGSTSNSFRLNAAGSSIPGASMGADNEAYVTSQSKGNVYSMPSVKISAKSGPKPWDEAYVSHRFTLAPVLSYSIPVPQGKYTVKVLFAETYFSEPKQRMFDLFVNGEEKETNLDVFARVGKNTGLLLSYSGVTPVSGFITVAVFKVAENPMISAIMIEGKGAGDVATGGGCTATEGGSGETLNNGFNHRAHAVPGGPYVAMDFSKKGYAQVDLDGTSSHSHFSDPGPPPVSGKIVSYKWSWTVQENGKDVTKMNQNKSGKFSANFPLGKTVVKLEVVDNTGDVAVDSTTVEVKSSTENGAYCYFYDFENENYNTVPIKETVNSAPKPQYGEPYGTINFNGPASLSKVKFSSNAFAIRCVFFIDVKTVGSYSYTVAHNGPFALYFDGKVLSKSSSAGQTNTPKKQFSVGLHSFQLHYFRPKSQTPKLVLSQNGKVLPPNTIQHDSSITLPVIVKLSTSTSAPSGGGNIQIYGSGFVNGVSVKFGNVEALNLISSDPGTVQVTVPPGKKSTFITVSTNAGDSNAFPFEYTAADTLDQPVIFEKQLLLDKNGNKYKISFAVDVKYGPDGRLYIATTKGELHAVTVDKNFKAVTSCVRKLSNIDSLLGIAFDPASPSLKMYFSVSVLYWKDYNILPFEEGWTNGKIKSIEWSSDHLEDSGGNSCAGEMKDVITGLPVSNHDHGINKLDFTPDGKLLISIGGFTNGGLSVPGKKPNPPNEPQDALGGVASNPLSAALVTCPVNKVTKLTYSTYVDPEKAKVLSGKECQIYATGLRNSFGMTWHTNGGLFATDNGPNANFGDFTTNCNGGTIPAQNIPDRLYLVNKGKWHGHPNLNRKECPHFILNPAGAVEPILDNIQSATPGIIEYRSNTFGGAIKGSLLLSKFAGQNEGAIGQVVLSSSGKTVGSWVPNFFWASGVSIAEGPRGEIAAARVYKSEVIFVTPKFTKPGVTFLLSVLPRNGPASGGNVVLISGFNFGNNPEATFGGKNCLNVKSIDDESFTCQPPSNSKGALVAVIVKGSTGESPTYGNDYWYW